MCTAKLKIGTFNVSGVSNKVKQEHLVDDAKKYKVDICCLQETKIQEERDLNIDKLRLITLETSKKHYGNGFLVSPTIANSVHSYWKVSDRIFVLQVRYEDEYQIEKTG